MSCTLVYFQKTCHGRVQSEGFGSVSKVIEVCLLIANFFAKKKFMHATIISLPFKYWKKQMKNNTS